MGKWAAERRKALFAELKESGKLQVPLYKPKEKKPKRKLKKQPKVLTPQQKACCLYKYNGNLPEHFVKCRGCRVK